MSREERVSTETLVMIRRPCDRCVKSDGTIKEFFRHACDHCGRTRYVQEFVPVSAVFGEAR